MDDRIGGMTYEEVASSGYRAYAASTGNKNYQGLPMPTWDELPENIKTAWEAAARQISEAANSGGSEAYKAVMHSREQSWNGWVKSK